MLETISELVEDTDSSPKYYFEVGKSEHESIATEEEIKYAILKRAAETRERVGGNKHILYTACNSLTVEALVNLNLKALESENEKEELYNEIQKFTHIIKIYNEAMGNRWEDIKNGLFAEVAVAVSLKQLGFDVYLPDFEDDNVGKVDLWIKDSNETENPCITPIQVKSSANINSVVVGRIDDQKMEILEDIEKNWDYGTPHPNNTSPERLKSLQNKLANTSYSMLEYLASLKNKTKRKIIPIAIIVPGGEGAENAMFNTRTATPSGKTFEEGSLATEIYNQLDKIIYKEEKKNNG